MDNIGFKHKSSTEAFTPSFGVGNVEIDDSDERCARMMVTLKLDKKRLAEARWSQRRSISDIAKASGMSVRKVQDQLESLVLLVAQECL